MFILRDFLEFSGLLTNKKRIPGRDLALLLHKKEVYESFVTQLTDALGASP